jgi:hypothetical protein
MIIFYSSLKRETDIYTNFYAQVICSLFITRDDQSDFVSSIALQSITSGDQSEGLIGKIDREAIDHRR